MRKSLASMIAQPEFSVFSQDIKAYQFFISKGNLKLDDDCTETWYLIRKYRITQDELNWLLGQYRYYRAKEQEEIAELAGLKFHKENMPTKEVRSIRQALTNLKRNKWLDQENVSSIMSQIAPLLLASINGKDFVNQQLVRLFLKKYEKYKNPELSLLIIQLADLMKLKKGKIEYNTMDVFFYEQGIEITNRGSVSPMDAIKKRYDRGRENIEELMWLRKCKTLLPLRDAVPSVPQVAKSAGLSDDKLIQKYGAEIAKQLASVPTAYRDIMAVFGDHYVTALEEFNKAIAVKAR